MTTTIPTEIWADVCEYACTDDGRAGRSLSLVSKVINAISRPYKYRSIVLRNTQQIKAFSQLLERDAPSMAQPVYHLLLFFAGGEVSRNREHLTSEFYSIIQLIHSHLRSLTAYAPGLFLVPTYTPAPILFSKLKELTIVCINAEPFFYLSSHLADSSTGAAAAALPRLRAARFHLEIFPYFRLLDTIAISSPALQILFINQVKLHDVATLTDASRLLLENARSILPSPADHATLHHSPMTIVLELMPEPRHPIHLLGWNFDRDSYRHFAATVPMNGLVVVDPKKALNKHTILRGWNDGSWPTFQCSSEDDFSTFDVKVLAS